MRSEDIFESITDIDGALIEEADSFVFRKKKRPVLPLIVSFAAAAAVFAGIGITADKFINNDITPIDGNNTVESSASDNVTEETDFASGESSSYNENTEKNSENETMETTPPDSTEPPTEPPTEGFFNPHIDATRPEVKPVALSEASYPKMTKYPALLGEYSPTYSAWSEDVRKFSRIEVETDNIAAFSKTLMAEVLTSESDKNNIVSPLNIYMALSLLAETTDGNSRQQILSLLGMENIDALREQCNKIWQKNYRDDGYMKSIMANSLWLNDSILYKKSAVNTIADKYFASVFSGTMGSAKYDSMLKSWVKENTGGLLSPDLSMDYNTVMAIASTLLYQTKWTNEFQTSATEKGTFYAPDGEKNVSYMKSTRDMHYYWGEKFSAISLGLDIGGSMWFILPDEGVDADSIFSDSEMLSLITTKALYGDYEKSKFIEVHMSIPKFDVSSEQDILSAVKKLGVTDITDVEKSDFSALASNPEGIFISKMSHGVRVKVDEEGVSAAAYTVIIGAGSAMPPDEEVYFTLDRPFAFVITLDNATPLFAGVVNNP